MKNFVNVRMRKMIDTHKNRAIMLVGLSWIFMSRFDTSVTDKHVVTMVTNRLALAPSDVVVRRLVKLGANVETMSFVSFKVGVPSSKREEALSLRLLGLHPSCSVSSSITKIVISL